MDEVNDVEDDSDLPKVQLPFPASTKNGSNKIGVSSSTKHCVTFDCNSAGRVTYTTVRCSIDDEIIDLPQQNVFTMSDIPLELVVDNNEQHLPELVTSIMKAGNSIPIIYVTTTYLYTNVCIRISGRGDVDSIQFLLK